MLQKPFIIFMLIVVGIIFFMNLAIGFVRRMSGNAPPKKSNKKLPK